MQVKWVTYLAEFDANFIYKPGKTNVADPLSRSPSLLCVMETRRMKRMYLNSDPETGLAFGGEGSICRAIGIGSQITRRSF